MSISVRDDRPVEAVGHLLSLGLTQLSIQVTLSTSLTASALGLAALATALTSTILTFQEAIAPYWQWTLLPSVAAVITGLLATAAAGARYLGADDVIAAYETAANYPEDVGTTVLGIVRNAFFTNDKALKVKDRLTAITLTWLLLSVLLIGLLNLACATLHFMMWRKNHNSPEVRYDPTVIKVGDKQVSIPYRPDQSNTVSSGISVVPRWLLKLLHLE